MVHGSRLLSELKFFYRLNESIEFECSEGYRMRGIPSIKCVAAGRWSGPVPDCDLQSATLGGK